MDPDLFFPVGNSGPTLVQIDEAKAVCGRCPVAQQCLSWAVQTGQVDGIWGGMTESERRAVSRREVRRTKDTVVTAA
nr:WhiB family transcriptional regulator [Streptomyces olivochromogenes]